MFQKTLASKASQASDGAQCGQTVCGSVDTSFSSELSLPGYAFRAPPLLTPHVSRDGEELSSIFGGMAQI